MGWQRDGELVNAGEGSPLSFNIDFIEFSCVHAARESVINLPSDVDKTPSRTAIMCTTFDFLIIHTQIIADKF